MQQRRIGLAIVKRNDLLPIPFAVFFGRLDLDVLVYEPILTPGHSDDIVRCLALHLGVAAIAEHLENEVYGDVVLVLEALPCCRPTCIR